MAGWIAIGSLNTFIQFSPESLENFKRACICAFLCRVTSQALYDFSPTRHSVLPIVFLVTMVPAALRSLRSSLRVVLGFLIPHRSHDHLNSKRWDLAWSPSLREMTVILCFFHLQITTPTVVNFSPRCLVMVLLPIPALCRSTIWLINCFCGQMSFIQATNWD